MASMNSISLQTSTALDPNNPDLILNAYIVRYRDLSSRASTQSQPQHEAEERKVRELVARVKENLEQLLAEKVSFVFDSWLTSKRFDHNPDEGVSERTVIKRIVEIVEQQAPNSLKAHLCCSTGLLDERLKELQGRPEELLLIAEAASRIENDLLKARDTELAAFDKGDLELAALLWTECQTSSSSPSRSPSSIASSRSDSDFEFDIEFEPLDSPSPFFQSSSPSSSPSSAYSMRLSDSNPLLSDLLELKSLQE